MKIDNSISQLLYLHDCVVVPELGGFVANYKSAQIQSIKNTLEAPSKSVSFNKNLQQNDGLLANHLVQTQRINYQDSCKRIEDYVASINQDLKLKKKVLIEDVGTLFLDADNRIQFNPENTVNYLLDSYGLNTFQKLPIKRVTLEEKITKEFKDRVVPLAVVKKKKRNPAIWAVAAAAVLAIVTVWGSQVDLSGDFNYATLFPSFKPGEKAVYSERKLSPKFIEVTGSNFKEKLATASENDLTINVSFIYGEEPVVVRLKNAPTIIEPVSTYVESKKIDLKYHIIVGCFSEKANAKKMVKTLKKKGLNAWLVGQRKKLWTVSYSSFATRKEAVEALALAQTENPKAWILNQ